MEQHEIDSELNTSKYILCSKCGNCDKHLNVPPIFCLYNNGDKICGRCTDKIVDFEETDRQYAFEDIAKFFTFPCCNRQYGCKEMLRWTDVTSHEKACTFKGIKCPLAESDVFPSETCRWIGKAEDYHQHVKKSHTKYIRNPPDYDNFDREIKKGNTIFFTELEGRLITGVLKYVKDDLCHCLLLINDTDTQSQCYRYEVKLISKSNSDNVVILQKSRLVPLRFMLDNLNNLKTVLKVDLAKLREMLESKEISCHFEVIKKSKTEIDLITDQKVVHLDILRELECPVCNEYMMSPINYCSNGHSICSECKMKVVCCPFCRNSVCNLRNYTLEKLSEKLNYPCRYNDSGCTFVSTQQYVRDHQKTCELSQTKCPMTCTWLGTRLDILNHLKKAHIQELKTTESLLYYNISGKNKTTYFFNDHNELFIFSLTKLDGNTNDHVFDVQHIKRTEINIGFQYKLKIICFSVPSKKISFANNCTSIWDLGTPPANGMIISSSLLALFVNKQQKIQYEISIRKV